jgi:hypothetical protein
VKLFSDLCKTAFKGAWFTAKLRDCIFVRKPENLLWEKACKLEGGIYYGSKNVELIRIVKYMEV